ncbi:MAG: prepilin-type N-terminal cleavage/methylation domain-containing protein [Phycisphaeraceae bacterium]|nr:prepilin-type N-terminal cleavage/methylation domain-containing protein [Phycisphaeraceae bacterium]
MRRCPWNNRPRYATSRARQQAVLPRLGAAQRPPLPHGRGSLDDGFTLVEVLGATVLLSLLMFAALNVTVGLHRQARALTVMDNARPGWQQDLVALLTYDLAHVQQVEMNPRTQTLTFRGGFSHLDADTRQPHHRPVEVTYHLVETEDTNSTADEIARPRWLVRKQVNLDDLSNRNTWSDLVCGDVKRFRLVPASTDNADKTRDNSDHSPQANDLEQEDSVLESSWARQPIQQSNSPTRVRLIVEWSDPDLPRLDRTLQVR